jgi:hypothetical protein
MGQKVSRHGLDVEGAYSIASCWSTKPESH